MNNHAQLVHTVCKERDHNTMGVIIMPVTQSIAEQAAVLSRKYHTPEIDALIAATTLELHGTLITKNTKDFRKITGLKIHESI